MKRTLRMTGLCGLVITCLLAVAACGDDDDDDDLGGGGPTPSGPTVTYGDGQLVSTGGITFAYDDKGRCISATSSYERLTVDYDRHTLTYSDVYDDDYDRDEDDTYNITFNSSGYITKLAAQYTEWDEEYGTMTSTDVMNFTYDGNGHLTGSNGTAVFEGGEYRETETFTTVYKWEGDLLVSMEYKEVDTEPDEPTETYEETVTVTYSETANKYNQWTHAMHDFMATGDYVGFMGLFGKGPGKLIASYTETYREYGGQEYGPYTYTTNVSHTLEGSGRIATETIGSTSYTYVYSGSNAEASQAKTLAPSTRGAEKAKHSLLPDMRAKMKAFKEKLAQR